LGSRHGLDAVKKRKGFLLLLGIKYQFLGHLASSPYWLLYTASQFYDCFSHKFGIALLECKEYFALSSYPQEQLNMLSHI
jgi:hypothetical protein